MTHSKSELLVPAIGLSNSILGAGIVSLPFALSRLGYFYGGFIFIVIFFYSLKSLDFLTRAAIKRHKLSFKTLTEDLFGRLAGVWSSVVVGLFSFAFLCAYVSLLTDISHDFLAPLVDVPRPALAIFLSYTILFPLCLLKSLHSLRYASASTILVITYLTVTVIVSSITHSGPTADVVAGKFDKPSLSALGTVGFAFSCHFLTLNVFRELPLPFRNRNGMFIVSMTGMGIAAVFYYIVAYVGYFTYGSEVDPSILNTLPRDSWLVTSAKSFMAIVMICSYPIVFAACREAIVDLILHFKHPVQHSDVLEETVDKEVLELPEIPDDADDVVADEDRDYGIRSRNSVLNFSNIPELDPSEHSEKEDIVHDSDMVNEDSIPRTESSLLLSHPTLRRYSFTPSHSYQNLTDLYNADPDEVAVMLDHQEEGDHHEGEEGHGEDVDSEEPVILLPFKLLASVAAVVIALSIVAALASSSISFILDLTGSLLGGLIVFILPALCLIKSQAERTGFDGFVAFSSILCGVFITIVGTWSLFM
ncbi:hypothetical protein P9112_013964 [Eukaryota sp. TZLM1-RC]